MFAEHLWFFNLAEFTAITTKSAKHWAALTNMELKKLDNLIGISVAYLILNATGKYQMLYIFCMDSFDSLNYIFYKFYEILNFFLQAWQYFTLH